MKDCICLCLPLFFIRLIPSICSHCICFENHHHSGIPYNYLLWRRRRRLFTIGLRSVLKKVSNTSSKVASPRQGRCAVRKHKLVTVAKRVGRLLGRYSRAAGLFKTDVIQGTDGRARLARH